MNNTKANLWLFNKKTKDLTFSYEIRQKARFVKGSIIAIILGLIIGGIIIAIQNVSPFTYLKYLFNIAFDPIFVDKTIQWLCIYIIAALAVGIGFKSGMFNIGVSGQMVMGSGVAIIFFKLVVEPHLAPGAIMNPGYIIVMFLICGGIGAIMAGIAGALKALFNIHEVVTTIMLNWTAWYLMKYLFNKFANTIGGSGIQSSGSIPSGSLTINGSSIAIPIIIAAVAVIAIAIILAKTTFGYKIKAVGASPSASKYAGFNVKAKMIDAMLISGLLAGIAGFINIFTIAPNMTFGVDTLPQVGYDSIAITLVAFNNPIGTVFSSFLWAVLQSGGAPTSEMFNLPSQMSQLIFGVIIYFAAISVVFINWYPIIKLRIMIALTSSKVNQLKIKNLRKQQLEYRKELLNINSAKDVQDYKKLINEQIEEQTKLLQDSSKTAEELKSIKAVIKGYKNDMNIFVKEYRKNLKEEIKKCSEQIKIIKKDNYISRINSAKQGIDKREWDATRAVEQEALSQTSLIKSEVLSLKDKYHDDLKTKRLWMKRKLKKLRKEFKLKLKQNEVWLESETGIKNHFWEMKNGKIEAKALINKIKINAHNEILNIKSDYQLARLDLVSQFKDQPEVLKTKQKALREQMEEKVAQVKAKEKYDIMYEHEKVDELTKSYLKAKKANEALAKQILAKKKSTKVKLAKNLKKQRSETAEFVKHENKILNEEHISLHDLVADTINDKVNLDEYKDVLVRLQNDLRDKNKSFTKSLKEHMAFKKALVGESGRLLKELNAENERDRKAIAKINDKHDTEGASLVDIKLAYNQRKQRTIVWYKEQRQIAFDKHDAFLKLIDKEQSAKNYEAVEKFIKEYKQSVSELGNKNTLKVIADKQVLLRKLIKQIKSVWKEEYSAIDNIYWSWRRYRTYIWINDEQAKLDKIGVVVKAQAKIRYIKEKAKWIRQMYNKNIKTFKDQYMLNKKVDAVMAQQNYYKEIEQFISKLEKSNFAQHEQIKEVK